MAAAPRDEAGRAGAPRQVRIDDASLTLRQPGAGGDVLRFGNVELSMAVAADGTFVGSLEGQRQTETGAGGVIALTAIGDFASRDMRLDVVSETFSAAVLVPFIPEIPPALAEAGRLSGTASLVVSEAQLAADIDMVSAAVSSLACGPAQIDGDTLPMVMAYQREAAASLAQARFPC